MAETLKPCPFCGGEAEMVAGTYRDGGYLENTAYVRCKGCGLRTYEFHECEPAEDVQRYATEMWNERAERTCRIVRSVDKNPASYGGLVHRCSSCGKAFPKQFFNNGWTKLNYCPTCGCRITGVIAKED